MNKTISSVVTIFVCLTALSLDRGDAQERPTLHVGVVLLDSGPSIRNEFSPGEDILARISLDNVAETVAGSGERVTLDSDDVITKLGFKNRAFHRFLYFTDPDGYTILAESHLPGQDPPPPLSKRVAGRRVQIGFVERIEGSKAGVPGSGWTLVTGAFRVQAFYNLSKPGDYSVKCVLSMISYPEEAVRVDNEGREFVTLGSEDWVGTIESSTVSFTIGIDTDNDGIASTVDTQPDVYSDTFDDGFTGDGMTAGEITARGDQVLLITEEPEPDGVRIGVESSNGSTPATVAVCDDTEPSAEITLDSSDEVIVTCSTVAVWARRGRVEVAFFAPGRVFSTALEAGNGLTFDPETLLFTAHIQNTSTVIVTSDTVGGLGISIAPGQSTTISPSLDGDYVADNEDNCPEVANADQRDDDGDGVGNACDGCPNDPGKAAPGSCGCGVTDRNADGDAAPDCIDSDDDNDGVLDSEESSCGSNPLDRFSTCEVCDGVDNDRNGATDEGFADSDDDGFVDCVDNCPHLPNQDQVDTPPTISAPADILVNTDAGVCEATNVTLGEAESSDNCRADPPINDASEPYALGSTEVTWTVSDNTGNTTPAIQVVTVEDNEAPVLLIPMDVIVEQQATAGSEVPLVASATDNCDSKVEISSDGPVVYPAGMTTVKFTAIDDYGNVAGGSMTVTVQGPYGVKTSALTCLAGHAGESKRFGKALRKLERSLSPRYWIDETHLDCRSGNRVFGNEHDAARQLMQLLRLRAGDESVDDDSGKGHGKRGGRRGKPPRVSEEALACAETSVERMMRADRILAETFIWDVEAADLGPGGQVKLERELTKAYRELQRGDVDGATGNYNKAIQHYHEAWMHAKKAARRIGMYDCGGSGYGDDDDDDDYGGDDDDDDDYGDDDDDNDYGGDDDDDSADTIVIGHCDTGVPDRSYKGEMVSDLIGHCAEGAGKHAKFAGCVTKLSYKLTKAGIINGEQRGDILSCVAQAEGDGNDCANCGNGKDKGEKDEEGKGDGDDSSDGKDDKKGKKHKNGKRSKKGR